MTKCEGCGVPAGEWHRTGCWVAKIWSDLCAVNSENCRERNCWVTVKSFKRFISDRDHQHC